MTDNAEYLATDNIYKYPSLPEALRLWEEGIQYRLAQPYGFAFEDEYRFHTKGVASAARAIASATKDMDGNKAYIFGLLHDCGKRISERHEGRFHCREGYEQMNGLGYSEMAKICVTHTFPNKNFPDEDYSYPQEWKDWARSVIKDIEYDDYDFLIALCDKFFEGMSMVSIEKRSQGIIRRYNLSHRQGENLLKESLLLKSYFDKKTGKDIYNILGIID